MKETIEYLKKDRKVNDTFMKKLQKVGFEIDYTRCGYWNNVECVRIGRSCIPLYETHFSDNGNSESLDYRYQNDVKITAKYLLHKNAGIALDKYVKYLKNMVQTFLQEDAELEKAEQIRKNQKAKNRIRKEKQKQRRQNRK